MLKPKFVHGLNAQEASRSVLNRLQNDGQKVCPWDDLPLPPGDDVDQDPLTQWTWSLG